MKKYDGLDLSAIKFFVEGRYLIPTPGENDWQLSHEKLKKSELEEREKNCIYPQYLKAYVYNFGATNITNFPFLQYTICEPEGYGAGFDPASRDSSVYFTDIGYNKVRNDGMYASVRGNTCLQEGHSYFEFEIINPDVRIGIARRETSCETPVGSDAYSYGLISRTGETVHASRISPFTRPLVRGDVVGFHVYLPIVSSPRDIVRTRVPVKFMGKIWLENHNYRSQLKMEKYMLQKNYGPPKPEEIINGSFCKIYLNGEYQGNLVDGLRDFRIPNSKFDYWLSIPPMDDGCCGYYPFASMYKGGEVKINTSSNLKFPIDFSSEGEEVKSLDRIFVQQICKDVLTDMIEDIVFEEMDAHECPSRPVLADTTDKKPRKRRKEI